MTLTQTMIHLILAFGVTAGLMHRAGFLQSSVRGVAMLLNLLLMAYLIWQMVKRLI